MPVPAGGPRSPNARALVLIRAGRCTCSGCSGRLVGQQGTCAACGCQHHVTNGERYAAWIPAYGRCRQADLQMLRWHRELDQQERRLRRADGER